MLDQLHLDQVRFLPNYLPPHHQHKSAIAAPDRKRMVQLAIQDNPDFQLETAELERTGISYSYDTMRKLQDEHPTATYYFIIGSDMVADLPTWHRSDELRQLVQFVGVRRPRTSVPQALQEAVVWVTVPEIEISSTMIRNKIRHHEKIRYLVPETVRKYIKEHNLYESRT